MERDSMGPLTPSLDSASLPMTREQRLLEKVGPPVTIEQLAGELSRLTACFGPPRDRTETQAKLMAKEWYQALRSFGGLAIERAVDRLLKTSKWFPTLSEVYELVSKDTDGWKDAIGIAHYQAHTHEAKPYAFARDGRSVDEEIAYRRAKAAEMKRAHAYTPALDQERKPAPASQEIWISDELRAQAKKHGYWNGEG